MRKQCLNKAMYSFTNVLCIFFLNIHSNFDTIHNLTMRMLFHDINGMSVKEDI